jgi:exonuclease SbcC
MIKSIFIQNFEAHTKTFLELDKGLNVISGASNNGKSSIIKALNWCLFNQPQGFSFRKHGSRGATIVKVVFDDDSYLERKRDNKINQYDCNGEILTALGAGVPEIVAALTDVSSINIQTQFNQFYLLQESAGEVARTLNEQVGLSIIDEALSKSGQIVNKNRNECVDKEEAIKEKKRDIDNYSWVEKAETLYNKAEEANTSLESTIIILEKVQSTITRVNDIDEQLNKLFYIDSSIVDKIKKSINDYIEINRYSRDIESIIDGFIKNRDAMKELPIPDCQDGIKQIKQLIKDYNMIGENEFNLSRLLSEHERVNNAFSNTETYLSCAPLYKTLGEQIDEFKERQEQINWLDSTLRKERELNEAANKIMAVIDKHRAKEKQIKDELKICPLCEKPFEEGCC